MVKDIDSDLVAEKNKLHQTSPWIWLLELEVSDSEAVRIAAYQQNVTWNGDTYYAFPFQISSIQQSAEGQLPTLNLVVANVSKEVQSLLDENDGLVRKKLWLRLVHSDHLGSSTAVIEERFWTMQATANVNAVTFQLGRTDLTRREMPGRRYLRDYCGHVYESTVCGYVGSLPTCDKTLNGPNGCKVHGDDEVANGLVRRHPKRYGGFPGIPRTRN